MAGHPREGRRETGGLFCPLSLLNPGRRAKQELPGLGQDTLAPIWSLRPGRTHSLYFPGALKVESQISRVPVKGGSSYQFGFSVKFQVLYGPVVLYAVLHLYYLILKLENTLLSKHEKL